jgi:hypothetical protein
VKQYAELRDASSGLLKQSTSTSAYENNVPHDVKVDFKSPMYESGVIVSMT